ncbi:hypothetical protein J6590_086250 [Homalodisca vitripennis]|nr:hypothetical protein J6590_086250 [Homalodisca vitripennis]
MRPSRNQMTTVTKATNKECVSVVQFVLDEESDDIPIQQCGLLEISCKGGGDTLRSQVARRKVVSGSSGRWAVGEKVQALSRLLTMNWDLLFCILYQDQLRNAYLTAIQRQSKEGGDLRLALERSRGLELQKTGQEGRIVHQSTRTKRVVDTDDSRHLSELQADGRVVTETKKTTEHEEIRPESVQRWSVFRPRAGSNYTDYNAQRNVAAPAVITVAVALSGGSFRNVMRLPDCPYKENTITCVVGAAAAPPCSAPLTVVDITCVVGTTIAPPCSAPLSVVDITCVVGATTAPPCSAPLISNPGIAINHELHHRLS